MNLYDNLVAQTFISRRFSCLLLAITSTRTGTNQTLFSCYLLTILRLSRLRSFLCWLLPFAFTRPLSLSIFLAKKRGRERREKVLANSSTTRRRRWIDFKLPYLYYEYISLSFHLFSSFLFFSFILPLSSCVFLFNCLEVFFYYFSLFFRVVHTQESKRRLRGKLRGNK